MNKRILIVLGAPNSPDGKLSSIATNRLDLCFKIFKKEDLILCTGGWGKHFNISNKPHSHYAKMYLINKGLLESCFLSFALSSNTVDDAVKAKSIISKYIDSKLVVITSDFHIDRVKLVFNEFFYDSNIEYIGAKNDLPKQQLTKTIEHEKKAIANIQKNGLYY